MSILLGHEWVVNLDHPDSVLLSLVVDQLEMTQHLGAVVRVVVEEDGEELELVDHLGQQLPVDVLHGVLLHLVEQPGEQLRLLGSVSVVDARLRVLEVEDGREGINSILRGKVRLVGLDKHDSDSVGIVVYLFKLFDRLVTGFAVLGVEIDHHVLVLSHEVVDLLGVEILDHVQVGGQLGLHPLPDRLLVHQVVLVDLVINMMRMMMMILRLRIVMVISRGCHHRPQARHS